MRYSIQISYKADETLSYHIYDNFRHIATHHKPSNKEDARRICERLNKTREQMKQLET